MKVRTTIVTMLIAATTATGSLYAQDNSSTTTPPPPPGGRYEQLMQRIELVHRQKLRDILNLDDETATKFFAIYDPAEKDITALVKERNVQEQKLVQLTQGDFKDGDVDPTIDKIKALNTQIEQQVDKLNDALKPVLTPRQRARLLVFEKEFNRKVREQIRLWRETHPNQRLPKRLRQKQGGAPAVH